MMLEMRSAARGVPDSAYRIGFQPRAGFKPQLRNA